MMNLSANLKIAETKQEFKADQLHQHTNDAVKKTVIRLNRQKKRTWLLLFLFFCTLVLLSKWQQELRNLLPDTLSSEIPEYSYRNITKKLQLSQKSYPSYLELLPWEEESMGESRICKPPDGIPQYCCLGSTSTGGHVDYNTEGCNIGADVYRNTELLALQALEDYPLPTSAGDMPVQHCDWCRIIDILIEKNWTLAFQGDSLSRQSFTGVECELRRRNLYTISLHETLRVDNKPRWRYGISDISELRIAPKEASNSTSGSVAIIRFYGIYRPSEDMVEVENIVMAQNDIVVFDHGLHYGLDTGDEFVTEMSTLVRTLTSSSISNNQKLGLKIDSEQKTGRKQRLKLVAWRETSAQHFDYPGGDYVLDVNDTYCAPIQPEHTTSEHRLHLMMNEIINITGAGNSPRFTILPFTDYTRQLHDLHPPTDCTHYCTAPSLWLPLWRTLRIAIDNIIIGETDDDVVA